MKKLLLAGLLALGLGMAAPRAQAAAPVCATCKMSLSTKKDKMHPVAVKIKGKTYYCCAACGAHKTAAKGKATGKKPVKTAALPMCPMCKTHRMVAKKDGEHTHAVKINGKTYYSCCPQS